MNYEWFFHFSFEIRALLKTLEEQTEHPMKDSVSHLYKKLFLSEKNSKTDIGDFVFLMFITLKSVYGKSDKITKESIMLGIKKEN